jgi:hypothetical protein
MFLTSCIQWPRLEPIRRETGGWNEAFHDAKVIVVTRVAAVETGPRHLRRATLAVENVLQGETRDATVEIYYHQDSDNSLEARARYVLFLMQDRGVLRAIWDHPRSAILVESGLHRAVPLPGHPAAEQVAAMLLTPGDGLDAARFARHISQAVAFAMDHLGRWRTAKLLKQLAADGRPPVRQSACAQLTAWYWGQDACWDQLEAGVWGGPTAASRAAEQQRRASTADPDRWWKRMSAASPPAELLDELRLLTTHKDPRIRARYCHFLRAHYPDERDCGCSQPPIRREAPGTRTTTGDRMRIQYLVRAGA